MVIYDDGSNLETKELLRTIAGNSSGRIKLITEVENMGIAHARNVLLEYVKGLDDENAVIFNLDSDDRLADGVISLVVDKMTKTGSDLCLLPYDYFFNNSVVETPDLAASKAKHMGFPSRFI